MSVNRTVRHRLILCLWPGLPQLWLAGSWSSLALAIGFGSLLDLLLVTTLLWTEWIEPALRVAGWTAVAVLWSVSIVTGWRWLREQAVARHTSPGQDLFPQALGEYLRGNWYEAETACKKMLRRVPSDVHTRLLLASLLRRTRRWPEADEQLAALRRMEAAAAWEFEIADEEQRLADAKQQATIDSAEMMYSVEGRRPPAMVLPAA